MMDVREESRAAENARFDRAIWDALPRASRTSCLTWTNLKVTHTNASRVARTWEVLTGTRLGWYVHCTGWRAHGTYTSTIMRRSHSSLILFSLIVPSILKLLWRCFWL